MGTVYVVISCDVDPDRERLLDDIPRGTLTWRGVTEGIPAVKRAVRGLTDTVGQEPVFTWFLRADEQIRETQGAYGWFARSHAALLRSLEASGDELGWHPHFWRRETRNGTWYQEVEDVDWQVDMLRRAHGDLVTCVADVPASVRMGWSYHTNRTCEALDTLGIAVDFSAIPGFRTFRQRPPTRGENYFDWHSTPRTPYRPSRADYRRPPVAREESLRMLEVPCFVSPARTWAVVGGVQLARKTGDVGRLWDALRRPTYCINVTARPAYYAPLVRHLGTVLCGRDGAPLVFETHFHADELVENRSRLYDLASVRTNLEAVVRTCREAGAAVEFVQGRRIPELWDS